jgi:hypothetical protein
MYGKDNGGSSSTISSINGSVSSNIGCGGGCSGVRGCGGIIGSFCFLGSGLFPLLT